MGLRWGVDVRGRPSYGEGSDGRGRPSYYGEVGDGRGRPSYFGGAVGDLRLLDDLFGEVEDLFGI